MKIEIMEQQRQVCIWLTRAESENEDLKESLKPLYQEYKAKKYLVAVFHSGKEDLKESIRDLLIYNKTRLRELEMEREKHPPMQKQRVVKQEMAR